jgi:hypothetical protein
VLSGRCAAAAGDESQWTVVTPATSAGVSRAASATPTGPPSPPAAAAAAPIAAVKALPTLAQAAISRLSRRLLPAPKSAAEFHRQLREMGGEPERQLQHFRSVPPQSYPSLYKQALEAQHLLQQAACLQACVAQAPTFALESLRCMGGVQRFGMVAMQLGRQGKQALALVMQELEGMGHEVAALRVMYKL